MRTRALTDLTFEDWVTHIFDHEVRNPEWYFDLDAVYWDGLAVTTVRYLTRLFQAPLPILDRYSDPQLNQGFWYLTGSGHEIMHTLLDAKVPMAERIACVRSIESLFAALFAAKCSPHLSHLESADAKPLNGICYMWWDNFPIWGSPDNPELEPIDHQILALMERQLSIPSIACQESALHGLGHWQLSYPDEVRKIVDVYLQSKPTLRPELRSYACAARDGCVL